MVEKPRPGWRLIAVACVSMLVVSGLGPVAPAVGQAAAATSTSTTKTSKRAPKITTHPKSATISRYGTDTQVTLKTKATGSKLKYSWQQRPSSNAAWSTVAGATKTSLAIKADKWPSGSQFRVKVKNKYGSVYSKAATLSVLQPTKTPAKDAEKAFGLTGLRQGLDLSAYQYEPNARVKMNKVAEWAGKDGFVILRTGTGRYPINTQYQDSCTWKDVKTGTVPIVADCAYPTLAKHAQAAKLPLGHYWFNGWISTIDTTAGKLFANGYTPTASAKQFVNLVKAGGNYTKTSTDPLVLDIEPGSTYTKTAGGKKYTISQRGWNPSEAMEFLTVARNELAKDGYQANLYVYMSMSQATRTENGKYAWAEVAKISRLWIARWDKNNGRIPASQPDTGPWAKYGGWSIWQYSANVRIADSGVGPLDGDIAKKDAWKPRA